MTIRIIKLENIRDFIDSLLIINTIIFLLTDLDMKIYMTFQIFVMSIQYIYFNSISEDIEYIEENETIAKCIPLAKVSFSKEWENNASSIINNDCIRFIDKNILIRMHLRFIADINFELHTTNLCNSNEYLNRLANLKPVIGIPVNES